MERLSADRAFLLLRYLLIATTAYLLLVEDGFGLPPVGVILVIAAALFSNVLVAQLPVRVRRSQSFALGVIVCDTLWITAVLLQSGRFNPEFFYLYFFVLLLAAIGNNLALIALGATAVCVAYVYLLAASGGTWRLWSSPSLIRIPFIFTTAAFYGYLVDRTRQERRKSEAIYKLGELKAHFASMASHEFRTSLAVIQTASDLLGKYSDKLTAEEKRQQLDKIDVQVTHMVQLLNEILTVGKGDTGRLEFNPTALDLKELCQALAQEAERTSHPPHPVRFSFTGSGGGSVQMDPKLLRVILANLLSNAAKFSPKESAIQFDVGRDNGVVCFRVQDQGIGIPEGDLARLFEAFHRGSNVTAVAGTGLGLAIVKRAVDRHGGTINIESKLNRGTTVSVTIPVAESTVSGP